jgi:hypothetical protein
VIYVRSWGDFLALVTTTAGRLATSTLAKRGGR